MGRQRSSRSSPFVVSLPLWFWFDRGSLTGFQFEEKVHDWIPSHRRPVLASGVDGISALLILLTTFLGFIAVLCVVDGRHRPGRSQYYVFLLLLQTGMIGVFMRPGPLPLLSCSGK